MAGPIKRKTAVKETAKTPTESKRKPRATPPQEFEGGETSDEDDAVYKTRRMSYNLSKSRKEKPIPVRESRSARTPSELDMSREMIAAEEAALSAAISKNQESILANEEEFKAKIMSLSSRYNRPAVTSNRRSESGAFSPAVSKSALDAPFLRTESERVINLSRRVLETYENLAQIIQDTSSRMAKASEMNDQWKAEEQAVREALEHGKRATERKVRRLVLDEKNKGEGEEHRKGEGVKETPGERGERGGGEETTHLVEGVKRAWGTGMDTNEDEVSWAKVARMSVKGVRELVKALPAELGG